jgi:hypothetical protein
MWHSPLALEELPVGVPLEGGAELVERGAVGRVPERRRVAAGRRVRDDTEEGGAAGDGGRAGRRTRTSGGPGRAHRHAVDHGDRVGAAAAPDADVCALVTEDAETSTVTVGHTRESHLDRRRGDRAKLAVRERVAGRVPVVGDL